MENAKRRERTAMESLFVYWPFLFTVGTAVIILILDPSPPGLDDPRHPADAMWPPTFDWTGAQAVFVLKNPLFLGTFFPVVLGVFCLRFLLQAELFVTSEHASMNWWLCNLFWFHIGCDVLSGYYQVMPVLTDLYKRMNPAHLEEQWHPLRQHLDAAYLLELLVEAPLAAWVLYLYWVGDPARYHAEMFALAVQFAGAITYYAPGIMRREEPASWLSHLDRACGAVWVVFPLYLLYSRVGKARTAGKRVGKRE